jgi:hypothetical protein
VIDFADYAEALRRLRALLIVSVLGKDASPSYYPSGRRLKRLVTAYRQLIRRLPTWAIWRKVLDVALVV